MTIREKVDKLVKEYFQIYKDLKPEFGEKAKSLALHDLTIGRIVYGMAAEELEGEIKEWENRGNVL